MSATIHTKHTHTRKFTGGSCDMPKGETRGDNYREGAHMILCRRAQYNKTESRKSGRKSSRDCFA